LSSPLQIYAVGATLVELITGDIPFAHLTNKEVELKVYGKEASLTDTLPADLGAAWQPLLEEIASYVQWDPKLRPTATDAIARLLAKYPELNQYVAVLWPLTYV
jgi:hypothetical protein